MKCKVEKCNCEVANVTGLPRTHSKISIASIEYCKKHAQRVVKYGTPNEKKFTHESLLNRFNRGINKDCGNGCWEWTLSAKSKNGYGSVWDNEQKKSRLAHRVSYELYKGEIPTGKLVMHSCDNPTCVNPDHLILGTHKLNGEDKANKKRSAVNKFFGENNAKSKLTIEQVKYIKEHTELKHTELANMFNLSPNCIRGVRIGRTWRHIK